MIKCMLLIRRAPHLSQAEFAEYWMTHHAKLAVAAAPYFRMRRYAQIHPRAHMMADALQASRGAMMGQFDGVAEVWWDSFEDMAAAAGETPAEIAEAVLKDEQKFVDLQGSVIWFGEEFQFWPEKA